MKIVVKTNSSTEYLLDAGRYEIHDEIVYFFNEASEILWVFKDWSSFLVVNESELNPENPDEFYENLKNEEKK